MRIYQDTIIDVYCSGFIISSAFDVAFARISLVSPYVALMDLTDSVYSVLRFGFVCIVIRNVRITVLRSIYFHSCSMLFKAIKLYLISYIIVRHVVSVLV